MATTDAEPTFIDTNVLVYANVASAPFHRDALRSLTELDASGAPI
jgi:predicted nucleic acid-binding protein